MLQRISSCTTLVLCTALIATPAAADGEILITQTKAIQGGVTPGDAPGFPISLTQPGSYRFASNITVPQGQDGIEVKEADVTIDLNGFRLHGQGVARTGIKGHGPHPDDYRSLTVRNGTIAGFVGWGIIGGGHSWIVESMRITENGLNGVGGEHVFRITNSTITVNGRSGIICESFCHVESSLISGNELHGIEMGSGSVINNTITDNGGYGIHERPEFGGFDRDRSSSIGYGNNSIFRNQYGSYNFELLPMDPNYCYWC